MKEPFYGILLFAQPVKVESNSSSMAPTTLTLGIASEATDRFDKGLDKPLPPSFIGAKFDAWIVGKDSVFARLETDIREPDTVTSWTVFVKSNSGFTLSWNKDALPGAYSFTLMDNGEELNMKAGASYIVKSPNGNVMSFEVVVTKIPKVFALFQNNPNLFTDATSISFQLPCETQVALAIYNTVGQKVRELVNESRRAGYHNVHWDGRDDKGQKVAPGNYFYKLETECFKDTKKMIVIR